jgi:hypothetical protein
MMELSEAALDAHGRVFLGTLQMSLDSLDVIATALSGHMTVFGFSGLDEPLRELSENDYSKGAFRRGATRFEFRDGGESIIALAVRKIDYERVLKMLTPPRGDPKLGPRPGLEARRIRAARNARTASSVRPSSRNPSAIRSSRKTASGFVADNH